MRIEYSNHWLEKHSKKKKNITNHAIEYVIHNSQVLKDKYWEDTLNAISRISPSGRVLKVVYKKHKKKYSS